MTKPDRPILNLKAACACGKVELVVAGTVRAMLLCSCLDCQKATGAGHAAVVTVDAADVTVRGETTVFTRPADSGAVFTRKFCPVCGTTVCAKSSRAPSWLMVPAGLFAGSNEWFQPNQLIFARSHQEWDVLAAALPRHEKYREAPANGENDGR
jgi:hypothetical protein